MPRPSAKGAKRADEIEAQPLKQANALDYYSYVLVPFLVLSWYATNIFVVMLNKYLLAYYGFRYPVLLTLCHMIGSSALCAGCVCAKVMPFQRLQSRAQLMKVAFLACIFASTVVLGNVSLKWIAVSFNQAIGATTPAFTALFSLLILKQWETKETYLTLIPVVGGIVVATGFEPSFHMIGFVAAITATSLRALKSIVQASLLTANEKLDSMNLLLYMAPIAGIFLVPIAMVLEPNGFAAAIDLSIEKPGFIMLLIFNCACAFLANLLNFLVTRHTSALTLQVLGNAKGGVAAIISVLVFQNPVTLIGILGYAVAVGGVVLYSRTKNQVRSLERVPNRSPDTTDTAPLLSSGSTKIDRISGHSESARQLGVPRSRSPSDPDNGEGRV